MAVAGFSVGEVTAAIFSGAVTLRSQYIGGSLLLEDKLNLHPPSSEGINLVKVRAEAMQAASEMVDSGMMTVFVGADQKLNFGCEVAREWCRRHHDIEEPVCQVFTSLLLASQEALEVMRVTRVIQVREVKIVMRCDVSPVVMFLFC